MFFCGGNFQGYHGLPIHLFCSADTFPPQKTNSLKWMDGNGEFYHLFLMSHDVVYHHPTDSRIAVLMNVDVFSATR